MKACFPRYVSTLRWKRRYIICFKQVKSLAAREIDVDLQIDTLEIKILLKNVSYASFIIL